MLIQSIVELQIVKLIAVLKFRKTNILKSFN